MPDALPRVLHLSTYDRVGGAARAAHRIHRALLAAGVPSSMLVADASFPGADVSAYWASPRSIDRLHRFFARRRMQSQARAISRLRVPGIDEFSTDRAPYGRELAGRLPPYDILHLHWCTGFVDVAGFLPAALSRAPIVVTLHDAHGLTGGCHYPGSCERWQHGCGDCPQLGNGGETFTARSWQRKHTAYRAPGRLAFASASRWMHRLASASPLTRDLPCAVLPYACDLDVFTPRDRAFARDLHGLSADGLVVLFVSDATANPRKGLDVLAAALSQLGNIPDLQLVSIGRGAPALPPGIRHVHLGSLQHERLLALAYSAADVFVIPSREEAFGQTALESLACGVPVIGSDTGGILDLVRPGETGLLFPNGDAPALAAALRALLTDPARRAAFGAAGRQFVETHHSPQVSADRHLALYRRLFSA